MFCESKKKSCHQAKKKLPPRQLKYRFTPLSFPKHYGVSLLRWDYRLLLLEVLSLQAVLLGLGDNGRDIPTLVG